MPPQIIIYPNKQSRFKIQTPYNKIMKLSESKTLTLLMLVLAMAALVQESKGHPCGSTFFATLVQLIPCRAAVAPFSPVLPTRLAVHPSKLSGSPVSVCSSMAPYFWR
ncbi:UNVERIFIED_CONTAM: hypothetical protein Sradi_3344400 [Sesamum radiatum]|uniref:Uncharacterized protein n=1 Tax=Sesamum radiatum TaxID=300843 RepID=A0AAW2R2F9_SESRA